MKNMAFFEISYLFAFLSFTSLFTTEAFADEMLKNTVHENIRMGHVSFDIPLNYLSGITQASEESSHVSFSIVALLPNLSPRTKENEDEFARVGLSRQFRALVEYPKHPRSPEDLLKFYLDASKIDKESFQKTASNFRLYKSVETIPHEIYTKETEFGLLFIMCDNEQLPPFPNHASCSVDEYLQDDVAVIYYFSRNYVDQADEIDRLFRSLLSSFRAH